MFSEKDKLVSGIAKIVIKVIREILGAESAHNIKPHSKFHKEEHATSFFNITSPELTTIIAFIADVLPEKLYLKRYEDVNDYAQSIIAKELILFLAQEDINSAYFKNNLENFRDEMLSLIVNDVYLDDNDQLIAARGI